jgi:hypothetical protein
MAKEEKKKSTLEERGYQFMIDNQSLGFSKVFVTSDGSVFVGNSHGENCAVNHAKNLEDKNILTVEK